MYPAFFSTQINPQHTIGFYQPFVRNVTIDSVLINECYYERGSKAGSFIQVIADVLVINNLTVTNNGKFNMLDNSVWGPARLS